MSRSDMGDNEFWLNLWKVAFFLIFGIALLITFYNSFQDYLRTEEMKAKSAALIAGKDPASIKMLFDGDSRSANEQLLIKALIEAKR